MCKKFICIILVIIFLFACLSSCSKRAPDYLEYQSYPFTAKGTITYGDSKADVTVTLKEENPPNSIYIRNGSISFTSPAELSEVTVEFSNDGTFISSGDVSIPIYAETLKAPNIISSLFSFEHSDIYGVTTKVGDAGTFDVIEVKNELLSAKIHIDHDTFLPTKIIADIDSGSLTFDISSIEFTDTEEKND